VGLVATVTSEAEPESDSEEENEKCLRAKEKQKSWYLDSGCSRHMTREKSMFLTLTMKEGGNVKFGGNQSGKIIGTRTIGNSSISINNVWLVDGLEHNLWLDYVMLTMLVIGLKENQPMVTVSSWERI